MQPVKLQFLRNADIETASWSELRSKHSDTRAVPDLVDLVEQVHDIEAYRGRFVRRYNVEFVRQPQIDLGVGRDGIGVGKASAQAAAVNHGCAEPRTVPQVGGAGRCGQDLGMVGVDIVVGDKA